MEGMTKLNEAFSIFTQASKSLETYYKRLHERVLYLTRELEEKNQRLKYAIMEAKESREYLQAILQSISEAIIVMDQSEKITMINRSAEKLLSIDAHNAIGKTMSELDFSFNTNGTPSSHPSSLRREGKGEGDILTVNGKRYDIIMSRSAVFDSEHMIRGYVITIKDVTTLKEMEQYHERNQRLIAMGEMAAKIVHEIRSPLCSIELFSTMLSHDLENTPHADLAQGISTGISSLNNILTNMLFFAKPQKPSFTDVRLDNTINESLKMLTPLIELRNIKIHKDITDELIMGDYELLKQVFMNIFLNAVQAMSEGGALKVISSEDNDFVVVKVSDEGEGINPENIEKIFNPFFSTKDKGTGLGLTITYKIMQAHKGFVKVFNNEDSGCTFCLYFPKFTTKTQRAQRKHKLIHEEKNF